MPPATGAATVGAEDGHVPCCSGCSGVLTPPGGRWSNAAAARRGVETVLETAGVGGPGLDDDGDESADDDGD